MPASVQSHAWRLFQVTTALVAATAVSSRPTPTPTATARTTSRVSASRPPLTLPPLPAGPGGIPRSSAGFRRGLPSGTGPHRGLQVLADRHGSVAQALDVLLAAAQRVELGQRDRPGEAVHPGVPGWLPSASARRSHSVASAGGNGPTSIWARQRPGRITAGCSRYRSSLVVIAIRTLRPWPRRPSVRLSSRDSACPVDCLASPRISSSQSSSSSSRQRGLSSVRRRSRTDRDRPSGSRGR